MTLRHLAAGFLVAAGVAVAAPPENYPTAAPDRRPSLSSRYHDYWIDGVEVAGRLGPKAAPAGQRYVVVRFTARNFDKEPRAVFVGALAASRAGKVREFVRVEVIEGYSDKGFHELWMGEVRTIRFAYLLPTDLAHGAELCWEPGRAEGRSVLLRPAR